MLFPHGTSIFLRTRSQPNSRIAPWLTPSQSSRPPFSCSYGTTSGHGRCGYRCSLHRRGFYPNRAWGCDHRLRRPARDRIGPPGKCDPCFCAFALGSSQGDFGRPQLTMELGVRRQATNGGLTKLRSFFPYRKGSPSPVRTHPPVALRRAWPAAVSHSEVRPKRG